MSTASVLFSIVRRSRCVERAQLNNSKTRNQEEWEHEQKKKMRTSIFYSYLFLSFDTESGRRAQANNTFSFA